MTQQHTTRPVIVVPLSYTTPPLSPNKRMHWAQKAKLARAIRDEIAWKLKAQHNPPAGHINFELHYLPKQNRRRDRGNLMDVHKAALDGVVDSGLVPDDSPQYVNELMPVIHPAAPGNRTRIWVEIKT